MNLIERCNVFENLFDELQMDNSRNYKEVVVADFLQHYTELKDDFDFVFEVLAGKHKLGYTLYDTRLDYSEQFDFDNKTIRQFAEYIKTDVKSDYEIQCACAVIPEEIREFIINLFNRNYKLGYSNKDAQIKDTSPMLAKKYPDDYDKNAVYYVQEKLDGNRCIAHYNYNESKWEFTSRSGKPLNVGFDMSWADKDDIFDGEIMTLGKAGSRDFAMTSGIINSKYLDKSKLQYFIYDIVNPELIYADRLQILRDYEEKDYPCDCTILNVLDDTYDCGLRPDDVSAEEIIEYWLNEITSKGGEGLILRRADGKYEIGKRSANLLKVKRTQTMDLRIVGWNEGKGKYEGMIGSFVCRTDDNEIQVDVAGISDDIRADNPLNYINRIIEVAYFDVSVNKQTGQKSLRFPRFKKFRDDKKETSKW